MTRASRWRSISAPGNQEPGPHVRRTSTTCAWSQSWQDDGMTATGVFRNAETTRNATTGTVIFEEGAAGNEMYGIIDGEVELRTSHGVVHKLGPDETFGEMSIVDSSPRM